MKAGAVRKLSGAEQRALAQQFAEADPKAEAWAKESSFLGHLGSAQDDLDWIISHEAWTHLGHDTFSSWWDARAPRMHALGFQPTKQIALTVLARLRADDEKLPKAQRRTNRQLAASVGLSEASVRRTTPRSLPASSDAEDDLGDTSATQSPPAADPIEPSHAGVPAAGGKNEERAEEEAAEVEQDPGCEKCGGPLNEEEAKAGFLRCEGCDPDGEHARSLDLDGACGGCGRIPTNTPAAATTSLPDGDGDPTPEPEQQPGQDSPTGLEAAQPRDDRSETDHQQDAGVSSPAGEAPEVASTDPVEPVELEGGGTAQDPPSSSDPDAPDAGELLLVTFAEFMHYLDGVDFEAVGPMLLGADLEALHSHVESITAYVGKLGRARFAEMLHTP